MHGRPRKATKPDDTVSAAKAAQLRSLQDQLLQYHHDKIYTKEALEIGAKLVEVNPEHYTAWNYRKLAVDNILISETDPDAIKSILNQELRVVESALRRNFKCYSAWYHRKWVLNKGFLSFDKEFRLLDQFQRLDSRNFHAWNYRRYVASLKNLSLEEELKFTTDMIDTNFSNYSAWHNRSVLLSDLLKQKAQGFADREKILTEEYELVHQAIFTDPDDQSGWFYHLWLLDQTVKPDSPVLVASWPPQGSDLMLSFEHNFSGGALLPFRSVYSDKGVFPVVLYFNQAVGGVDSSAITIEYMFNKNEDLTWMPLSTDNSGSAQAWVTYLNFPDAKGLSKSHPVDVKFGHSQGIVTSTGCHYCHSSQFAFTVRLHSIDPERSEVGSDIEMVVWKDDNFNANEKPIWDLSSIGSFDQLRIDKECEQKTYSWHAETISNEIALFRELLSEIDCKIGKLTLARLLKAHDAMMSYQLPSQQKRIHSEEVLDLFIDLMKLDPCHSRFYKDEHSLVLLEQMTSTSDSLLRYCCQYNDQTSLSLHNLICLRLKNMSLSRIGFSERLLWVQMLDLSHNELHSIEGLEAMQLLSCLNLSNNKLRSLTALEPLRLLKSLKVLDISYNEIGAHYIDTTRYLCASPLSQAVGTDWNINDVTNGVSMREYWEAVVIFKGLHLTQLDVVGNAIADEKFKIVLSKVLPCLKWLDGEEVH
ncbi:geranylgeranyl transferase type-2 subunit alpha 1 [Telopea speciosissima]|uniref:geranylgeranyl transferase type-2 subunit alpha 1 n=1 Tax=Telopea speciosissima TaxID=54955 RepID=UPI001CC39F45|nr:geranylgeranyl transferase type-2 subunit alpha 1 [Telopea speciosissima]